MKPNQVLPFKSVHCPRCGMLHIAKRSDAKCSECKAQRLRDKSARRRAQNPEKARAEVRAWKATNPEKVKANKRKFQEKNRAYRCAYQRAREAEKLRATPKWADMDAIEGMYQVCGLFRRIGINLHVDHIIPLNSKKASGLHVAENLQLLLAHDNLRKKNRLPEEVPV
jgi:5-methylcytosine-specific restriction endonuclease McrA